MSRLSFKTFCIEFYSEYKNMPSNEVYLLFKKERILDMLDNDYEDLHGCGFEYLVSFIDKCLRGTTI